MCQLTDTAEDDIKASQKNKRKDTKVVMTKDNVTITPLALEAIEEGITKKYSTNYDATFDPNE